MTKLSINSPHQVESASKHLEETMKIKKVPDTSRQPTWCVPPKPVSTIHKNDEIVTTDVEFQELRSMQQAFKSINNWNFLQPGNEIEWLTITQDFLKGFPNVHSKQTLQLIIALMKFHMEAKNMALVKLHRAIEEENYDPLEQFFPWITLNYELSKRLKMLLLQKAIESKKLDWKSNPADKIEVAIQEAQLTIREITKNQFLSNLKKEILRHHMPSAYYVKVVGMNIKEMLQKIPEIWNECGSHEITFPYRKQRCMRNNYAKHHGHHAPVIKKKIRYHVRLCYCCRQKGHLAKDCIWNKNINQSN